MKLLGRTISSGLVTETNKTGSHELEASTRCSFSDDGGASIDGAMANEFGTSLGCAVGELGLVFGAVVAREAEATRWSKALRAMALFQ